MVWTFFLKNISPDLINFDALTFSLRWLKMLFVAFLLGKWAHLCFPANVRVSEKINLATMILVCCDRWTSKVLSLFFFHLIVTPMFGRVHFHTSWCCSLWRLYWDRMRSVFVYFIFLLATYRSIFHPFNCLAMSIWWIESTKTCTIWDSLNKGTFIRKPIVLFFNSMLSPQHRTPTEFSSRRN